MAIIRVPINKIFNYNYNVLRDNYINKIYINEEDAYNFIPINFAIAVGANVSGINANLEINTSQQQEYIFYDEDNNENTDNSNMYYINYGYIQLPNNGYYDFKSIANSINKVSTGVVSSNVGYTLDLGVSHDSDYRNSTMSISEDSTGGQIIFKDRVENDGKWYFKIAYLYRLQGNVINYNDIKIYFNPSFVENTYIYQLNDESSDKYSLPSNTFFDKLNVEETTNDSLFKYIAKDIAEDYEYGLMGLEIETRVSNFYYTNGSQVNDGKPYLIKVGDIIIPEFPNRLKVYEKEFIVTSSQYEYSGVDAVILKMIEYRERETGAWHLFYSTSTIDLNFNGVSYRYVISSKALNDKTKKVRIKGNITWEGATEYINTEVDVKVENGFNTNIFVSGNKTLSLSILNSSYPQYYSISSTTSASISNFNLDEYY